MNKKLVVFMAVLLGISVTPFAQTVSDVRFEQEDNRVKITYHLEVGSPILVYLSKDGGITWEGPLQQVSGDVGSFIQSGNKTIWWDALWEYEEIVSSDICFKVCPEAESYMVCSRWSSDDIFADSKMWFCANGYPFAMMLVDGAFSIEYTSMSEKYGKMAEHRLLIGLPLFGIGEYEVTQGLWKAVMDNSTPYIEEIGDDYPIVGITYDDCQLFVRKLNNLLHAQLSGRMYFAIATEAQWEYAARGGDKSTNSGSTYSGNNSIDAVAWHVGNSGGNAHSVGQKQANELGLYDMSGNVWEMCKRDSASSYLDIMYGSKNMPSTRIPESSASLSDVICRGGGCESSANDCRISSRADVTSLKQQRIGMRLSLNFYDIKPIIEYSCIIE